MSKCTEIREICGDYALDIEYSKDYTFTMFFNSRRNAEPVKRCIEVDDSVPNAATAVDFVEVVRCGQCKKILTENCYFCTFSHDGYCTGGPNEDFYCADGERREENDKAEDW